MAGMEGPAESIKIKVDVLLPCLDERRRRLWATVEAQAIGRGGISWVAEATGLSRNTVRAGLRELAGGKAAAPADSGERQRRHLWQASFSWTILTCRVGPSRFANRIMPIRYLKTPAEEVMPTKRDQPEPSFITENGEVRANMSALPCSILRRRTLFSDPPCRHKGLRGLDALPAAA